MDLNPYKFEAPWSAWEFAYHVLHKQSNLVVLSMAWLTREEARPYSRAPKEPDMETLSYWLARLEPVIRAEAEGEIIVVLANRCGTEDDAVYAGTSAVLGIEAGEVKVYGILGRGERELLVVDTNLRPQAKLISDPTTNLAEPSKQSTASASSDSRTTSVDSTFSERSIESSSTSLSIDTRDTERISSQDTPATPTAMDTDTLEMTIDVVTPVSPVDPRNPSMFFGGFPGKTTEVDSKREHLRSTIDVPESAKTKPDSPTLSRREPPLERVRDQQHGTPPPISHDDADMVDAPTFVRPPSPKSRNCSRTRHREYQDPALMSHDLAQEPQMTTRALGVKLPPYSASAVPDYYKETLVDNGLNPRRKHVLPRPKSMIW